MPDGHPGTGATGDGPRRKREDDMSETITITGNIATEPEHKRTAGGVSDHDVPRRERPAPLRPAVGSVGRRRDELVHGLDVPRSRRARVPLAAQGRSGAPDRAAAAARLGHRQPKQGTTVEIDAEAIGHDLLWGTTRFEKDGPAAPSARQTPSATTGPPPERSAEPSPMAGRLPGAGELEAPSSSSSGWRRARRRRAAVLTLTASARGGGP